MEHLTLSSKANNLILQKFNNNVCVSLNFGTKYNELETLRYWQFISYMLTPLNQSIVRVSQKASKGTLSIFWYRLGLCAFLKPAPKSLLRFNSVYSGSSFQAI